MNLLKLILIFWKDHQINHDGQYISTPKTHDINSAVLETLIKDKPDYLIIATGWFGLASVSQEIKDLAEPDVIIKSNATGLLKFLSLKKTGKVSLHYHSSC
ncbi:MAG: hypothetical protein ACYTFY_22690 [Planctomycetota bacterium]|jgi:hypothetical protein